MLGRRARSGKMNVLNTLDIPKFLAVDFYCGAGGTTRGLLDAGGYVIAGLHEMFGYYKSPAGGANDDKYTTGISSHSPHHWP